MAQNLALSLFKILYSQDRFYMKSLEFKKKSQDSVWCIQLIIHCLFAFHFPGSSIMCDTRLKSWFTLKTTRAGTVHVTWDLPGWEPPFKNLEWVYYRLLIPKLSQGPNVGTSGSPVILVGSLFAASPIPQFFRHRPRKLESDTSWETVMFSNCVFMAVLTELCNSLPDIWACSEWEDKGRSWMTSYRSGGSG